MIGARQLGAVAVGWAVVIGALALAPSTARAQVDQMPDPSYYGAVNELYSGQYRSAERVFRRLARTSVQAGQARFVDVVCYHAMLGETLYQQGRNAEALASFDQACLMLISYADFMQQVRFDAPRPLANPARVVPPWGPGVRRFEPGDFPRNMQIAMGSLSGANQAMQKGGTFLQAQFWRLNVAEVIRTGALAMRRRNELLGPLGKHDRLSKELATVMTRSNLTQSNHWSQGWSSLLGGIARAGVGEVDEAKTRLDRAVVIGGRFDHPLTGVALLEQGKLAMAAGDHRTAAQLLLDASITAYAYDDLDVVTESLRLGWANFLASGTSGLFGPLAPAAQWAGANRLWHTAVALRLAEAENLLRAGQGPNAAAIVEDTGRRIGEMRASRLGLKLLYLQAVVQVAKGQVEPASAVLQRALAGQRVASIRNFQIARAADAIDAGDLASRLAPEVFGALLADPTPADWAERAFDTLAVASTPHGAAFDRWFLAAIDRKDTAAALEVSERAKRARFLSTLPLGGRLLALRSVLEAPTTELTKLATIERQQLAANFPAYAPLAQEAAQLGQTLRAGTLQQESGPAGQAFVAALDAWAKNTAAREHLLLAMALSPSPATPLFPPLRTTAELKESLAEGQALIVFHMAGGQLYGFLVSRKAEHTWLLGDVAPLQKALTEWLRNLGNYSASRTMGGEELKSEAWRDIAGSMWRGLFAGARLDLDHTTSLAIVPDGWLWYLPFEALIPTATTPAAGGSSNQAAGQPDALTGARLIERVPLHYAPLASLAVGDRRALRALRHTGIVATSLAAREAKDGEESLSLAPLEAAVTGPVRMTPPLAQPGYLMAPLVEQLVVLDDIDVNRNDPYAWSPFPKSRGKNADSLAAWMGLPYEGPERVIVTGWPTAAETGLKAPRKIDAGPAAPGSEIFNAACGLMASGARTVLISRWRTGGQMNLQLVREFVQELSSPTPADVAWQRSVMLAQETPLDPALEPRLKRLPEDEESPGADHPFFWAGYLLIDSGTYREPAPAVEADVDAESPTVAGAAAPGGAPPTGTPASQGAASTPAAGASGAPAMPPQQATVPAASESSELPVEAAPPANDPAADSDDSGP